MSSVFEEILTSSVGFIIAMVILTAVVAGGLYGYWVYANHVTLGNYLWPVAEVLPYKGEYFLGVVNTGNEPFVIKQIYLKGGSVITPGQAANPGLSWCSVSNTELVHNEWWCGEVNQLPVAVMVCSALDPRVCSVVPVHGWQVVTFSQPNQAAFGVGNASCPILVVVNDPYNAGWKVTWSYPVGASSLVPNPPVPNPPPSYQIYEMSGSSTYEWCIDPPYTPVQISFTASLTSNPPGLTCQIVPTSVSKTYSAGSVQEFTVVCPITVTVNDPYNAGWQISWSGAASGSKSGSSSTTFEVTTTSVNGSVAFTASIPSPFSSICSITPTNATAYPGQTVTFTVSCTRPPYFVYVTVTGDSCGIGWTIYSSVSSISGTGNVKNAMLAIGGYKDWLQVVIWQAPNGQWSFEPGGTWVTNGSSVTFTAKCPSPSNNGNNNYYIYVVVTNDSLGAGWQIKSSVSSVSGTGNTNSPQQLKIGGQTDTVYASITSNPSGYTCTISPSSDTVSSGATYTFTVNCVQGSSQPPPTTYGCFLTVSGQSNPQGAANVNVGPSGTVFVPSGQTETIVASAPLSSGGGSSWYEFDGWSGSVTSGQGSLNEISSSTSGNAQSTWQYACPSGLTRNVTATATIVANYAQDYIKVLGPTSISSSPVQYTLEWNVAPGSASQVSWSISHGSTVFTISVTLQFTEYGKSLSDGTNYQVSVTCSSGQPYITGASISPQSQPVSGSSGTATATVQVTWQCYTNTGPPPQ